METVFYKVPVKDMGGDSTKLEKITDANCSNIQGPLKRNRGWRIGVLYVRR